MKRQIILLLSLGIFVDSSFAVMGVGDITFDPTSYATLTKQYNEILNLYKAAKEQVDNLQKIDKTIRDAQQVYQTVSSMDLKGVAQQMKFDTGASKSIAGMKAEIDRIEAQGGRTADYVAHQRALIAQLSNLEILQKASSENIKDSTATPNAGTAAAITAQSTAALAALASAEEQRHIAEDFARKQGEESMKNKFAESSNIYKALAK